MAKKKILFFAWLKKKKERKIIFLWRKKKNHYMMDMGRNILGNVFSLKMWFLLDKIKGTFNESYVTHMSYIWLMKIYLCDDNNCNKSKKYSLKIIMNITLFMKINRSILSSKKDYFDQRNVFFFFFLNRTNTFQFNL